MNDERLLFLLDLSLEQKIEINELKEALEQFQVEARETRTVSDRDIDKVLKQENEITKLNIEINRLKVKAGERSG